MADYTPNPAPPGPWRDDVWAQLMADAETANAGREPVSPEEYVITVRTALAREEIPQHPDTLFYANLTWETATEQERTARGMALSLLPWPGHSLQLRQGTLVRRFGGQARDALNPGVPDVSPKSGRDTSVISDREVIDPFPGT